MPKILIVEDEQDIADLVAFNLQRQEFDTIIAHDGIEGVELALQHIPDLIILDLMMPGKDGISVFKDLRRDPRTNTTPVIMLTAKAQTEDKIVGLEIGADDYVTKPFSPKELVLRVQALLKRSLEPSNSAIVKEGPLYLDKNAFKCFVDGEPVDLTSTEFKLLLHLAERPGLTQERNDLLRRVWGYHEEAQSRTLDTHLKRLRHKLGKHSSLIDTVRGVGYRLVLPTE